MRSTRYVTSLLATLLLASVAACARRSGPAPGDGAPANGSASDSAPVLLSLTPDTVALGPGQLPTLVLTGRGFAAGTRGAFGEGDNTVQVGRARFERIGANPAGTEIRFTLPFTYPDSSVRNRPAGFLPGDHAVSVITARGSSNALTLTMIP